MLCAQAAVLVTTEYFVQAPRIPLLPKGRWELRIYEGVLIFGVGSTRLCAQIEFWRITAYKRCGLRALRAGRIACEGGPSVVGVVNWEA